MMEEYLDIDGVITKFLLNTTRLRPRLTEHAVMAAIDCAMLANQQPSVDEEAVTIPLTTGSVAEFYIEPMLKCFGDVDVMFHENTSLAIPEGHLPPTQLPDDFHSYVYVHEIIDLEFPGYAYLELRYLLTQCREDGTYNAVEYDRGMYLPSRMRSNTGSDIGPLTSEPHGPAQQLSTNESMSIDLVRCERCLLWPTQAVDWPTRHRNYEWPDSATVDRVVSNGCDLVRVAHPKCKEHRVRGKYQWRLSFSRAEIVLMNSWMPLQQIVYHLLRVFLKTVQLTESADNSRSGTLCNYHIKTLMLWACEKKPRSWWTDDFSFTAICSHLLHVLSQWLYHGCCPHYFILGCNLFDHSNRANQILAAQRLSSVDQNMLIRWFIDIYLPKCCQLCPINISQLFDGNITKDKLQRAVSAVVDWRVSSVPQNIWLPFEIAQIDVAVEVSYVSLKVRAYDLFMKELRKLDSRLCDYLSPVACLHFALKLSKHRSADEYTNLLVTMCYAFRWDVSSIMKMKASELVEFLQKSAVDGLTAFRQLAARDFGYIITIVTTDFEAMYAYKRGDYQHCLKLSTQNVRTLLYAVGITQVPLVPEFIQLLDDDIVSLTALTLIVNPERNYSAFGSYCVSQLTLSLYLMTQCQLKLRHPAPSLFQTLNFIEVAQRRLPLERTVDHLTLKLAERKIVMHFYGVLTTGANLFKAAGLEPLHFFVAS